MNRLDALNTLSQWDKKGCYVLTKQQLAKLFPGDTPKTFTEGLSRLVKAGLLVRACRGVYVYLHARSLERNSLKRIIAWPLFQAIGSYVSDVRVPVTQPFPEETGLPVSQQKTLVTLRFSHLRNSDSHLQIGIYRIWPHCQYG